VNAVNVKVGEKSNIFEQFRKSIYKFIKSELVSEYFSSGSHDLRELYKYGSLPILFMPRGGDHHTDNEWVNANDLELLQKINLDFIRNYIQD